MILAGDIGGTNTRLALFDVRGGRLVMRERGDTKNAGESSLAQIVTRFLATSSARVEVACFGVAGPVKQGRVTLTNLKWSLDERKLSRKLGIKRVALINDLAAHAEGTNVLSPKELLTLHKGTPVHGGNRAIVAPGTGLGEGGLVYDTKSDDYRAFASEGGHSDFAPRDDREVALMRFVRRKLGRCDVEDVISGPGLRNVYTFLTSPGEFHVKGKLPKNPDPADITSAANSGSCRASVVTVEMFATMCLAEAGNMACKVLATGGVYIGGGIPPHVLKFLKRPQTVSAFWSKGPPSIQKVLRAMPIRVILSGDNALYGAAHFARRG
jgi:glucokinase